MKDINQKLTQAIHELIPEAGLIAEPLKYDPLGPSGLPKASSFILGEDATYGEPTLRHVLWALDVSENKWQVSSEVYAELEIYNDENASETYDLTESLYEQTEETKQWLLDLLTQT
jgi:hypothetical protein